MAKLRERARALYLRKQGKSYNQIRSVVRVSKSSLSLWLRDYPLSRDQMRQLRDWSAVRIEKFRATMRSKKEHRLQKFYHEQRKKLLPLTKREILLCGFFLYWGEGAKTKTAEISLSNTDPSMLRFFLRWLKIFGVTKNMAWIRLHLYDDMHIRQEMQYWSTLLSIPLEQFRKPYIKKSSRKDIDHRGSFGHGTCNIIVSGARLSERVLMTVKAMSDRYGGVAYVAKQRPYKSQTAGASPAAPT